MSGFSKVKMFILENLPCLLVSFNRHDERRADVFNIAFTFQFAQHQRQELLQSFEKVQLEMREFMTFYENYAEPLTERYFPEKLGTVQQYIEDFKQRDQQIGTALARQNKYMNNRIEQDHHFIKKESEQCWVLSHLDRQRSFYQGSN